MKLPQLIADPLYILKSNSEGNEHRFVVVTSSRHNRTLQRLSIIFNPKNSVAVVSAYDENINISEEKKAGRVLYNKKEELSKTLSASKAVTIDNSNNNIPQNGENITSNQANVKEHEDKNIKFQSMTQEELLDTYLNQEFGMNTQEITDMVKEDVLRIMDEAGVNTDEFNFEDIRVYGSYSKGTNKKGSDLDIIVQYSGNMSEDRAIGRVLTRQNYNDK